MLWSQCKQGTTEAWDQLAYFKGIEGWGNNKKYQENWRIKGGEGVRVIGQQQGGGQTHFEK